MTDPLNASVTSAATGPREGLGRLAVLVPAAGIGVRLGPGAPKALRTVGGVPLLSHAVATLRTAPSVDLVVVAAPVDDVDEVRALVGVAESAVEVVVVAGGATRQQSVALALAALPADVGVVLVHDAARALTPVDVIEAVAHAVRAGADAVVPGIPVSDTVKSVDDTERVTATIDRSHLRAVQTPQGFRRSVLAAAHAAAAADSALAATDDAGLVEQLGFAVDVVPGSDEAFKITRPLDLVLAEALLAARQQEVAL